MPYTPEPNTSISHGTMRTVDLLASLSGELARYDNAEVTYAHVLGEARQYCDALTIHTADDSVIEDCARYVVDELFDTLGQLAPEGCYFGWHPGDGSDYGYWQADCDGEE